VLLAAGLEAAGRYLYGELATAHRTEARGIERRAARAVAFGRRPSTAHAEHDQMTLVRAPIGMRKSSSI
jgi:hypothetical protein